MCWMVVRRPWGRCVNPLQWRPQVIAVDELGSVEDVEAVEKGTAVRLSYTATIHAEDMEELKQKALWKSLLRERAFRRIYCDGERKRELCGKKYIWMYIKIYTEYVGNIQRICRKYGGNMERMRLRNRHGKISLKDLYEGMTKGGVRCFDCSGIIGSHSGKQWSAFSMWGSRKEYLWRCRQWREVITLMEHEIAFQKSSLPEIAAGGDASDRRQKSVFGNASERPLTRGMAVHWGDMAAGDGMVFSKETVKKGSEERSRRTREKKLCFEDSEMQRKCCRMWRNL